MRDQSTAAAENARDMTPRPSGRLHWELEGEQREHALDILLILGGVRLEVDGVAVASVPKPSRARPWLEHALDVDGHQVTVVLTFAPMSVGSEVFRDGTSLLDGRTLEDARAQRPMAPSRFELWTAPPVSGISELRVAPPWLILFVAACLTSLSLLAFPRVEPGAPVAFAGLMGIMLVAIRTWVIAIARARTALVRRNDLGDGLRLGLLAVVVLAGAVLVVLLPLLPVVLLDAIRN